MAANYWAGGMRCPYRRRPLPAGHNLEALRARLIIDLDTRGVPFPGTRCPRCCRLINPLERFPPQGTFDPAQRKLATYWAGNRRLGAKVD